MNPARFAIRQSRAILLLTVLLVTAGVFAYVSLPSSIYPPLEFPRIVAIAHSGSTPARSMMLTVARPLEQSIMEVPGVRRVRSKTFRGATLSDTAGREPDERLWHVVVMRPRRDHRCSALPTTCFALVQQ